MILIAPTGTRITVPDDYGRGLLLRGYRRPEDVAQGQARRATASRGSTRSRRSSSRGDSGSE